MKKRLFLCLCVCMMALMFAVPVMAADVAVNEPASAVDYEGVVPHNEVTQIFLRTYNGVLQMRVWSVTRGRWITDWMDVPLL